MLMTKTLELSLMFLAVLTTGSFNTSFAVIWYVDLMKRVR
jgi:hypothetical protein